MQFLLRPGPSDGSKCVSLHYIIAGLLPSHDTSFEVIYLGETILAKYLHRICAATSRTAIKVYRGIGIELFHLLFKVLVEDVDEGRTL